jgi:hypothetical protein
MAKKPCEYCEEEMSQIIAGNTNDLLMELYPGKVIVCFGYFTTESGETLEASVEIPMNYCPNCGRKLTNAV